MREVDRIVDQLRRAYSGDAWHGPSVRAALEGVNHRTVTARPVAAAHSIAEIVQHMTAWTREVTRRLRTGVARDPEIGDWPLREVTNDADWNAIVAALDAANDELVETMATLDEAELGGVIGDARDRPLGSGVSRYVLLHGLVQHHVYHAGQISLLKKALES
jgi:uncharacterized damage-inducible protein DinB